MDCFFKHFGSTEGMRTGNNSACKLLHITESELTESIKDQKLASIDAIRIYNNFGIHYSVRVTLISSNSKPIVYLLTSNCHHVLLYESSDSMLSALRTCGYHPQKTGFEHYPVLFRNLVYLL